MYPAQNTVISESYDNLGRGSTKKCCSLTQRRGTSSKGISRSSRQFTQRKANCRKSIPWPW